MEFPHTCLTHTHCVLQSESNVQGILVSRPEVGIPSFGLTEKGKIQAREVNTGPTLRPGKLDLLFHISHLLDLHAGGRSLSLLANTIYTWQIYDAMAIKSGCVIAWKVIMTVEAAGACRLRCKTLI